MLKQNVIKHLLKRHIFTRSILTNLPAVTDFTLGDISGSQGNEYEDGCLLGSSAV
jgi:hypothetical protein